MKLNKANPKTPNPDVDLEVLSHEFKQYFLDNAKPLLVQYIQAATGEADLQSTNSGAREEIWSVVKELILRGSDKIKVSVNSPEDVLAAVSSGKCTVQEAKELMAMFKQIKEINQKDLPQLGSGGDRGLQINIMSGSNEPSRVSKVIEHEE